MPLQPDTTRRTPAEALANLSAADNRLLATTLDSIFAIINRKYEGAPIPATLYESGESLRRIRCNLDSELAKYCWEVKIGASAYHGQKEGHQTEVLIRPDEKSPFYAP